MQPSAPTFSRRVAHETKWSWAEVCGWRGVFTRTASCEQACSSRWIMDESVHTRCQARAAERCASPLRAAVKKALFAPVGSKATTASPPRTGPPPPTRFLCCERTRDWPGLHVPPLGCNYSRRAAVASATRNARRDLGRACLSGWRRHHRQCTGPRTSDHRPHRSPDSGREYSSHDVPSCLARPPLAGGESASWRGTELRGPTPPPPRARPTPGSGAMLYAA